MQSTHRVLIGISAIIFVAMLGILPKWTVDDAFISYRYGKNLVEAGELTWNPGEEPRVEGYTGVLLPIISAASIKIGLDPVMAGRLLGILGYLLALFCLWRITIRLYDSKGAASFAVFWLVTYPFLYTHALSGLETMLFLGLLTYSMLQLVKLLQNPGLKMAISLGLALLLSGLTRPEGAFLAAALGLTLILYRKKLPAGLNGPMLAVAILAYLIPATVYFLWRWNYYEAFLPNTFYAKAYAGWVNPESLWAWGRFALKFVVLPASIFAIPAIFGLKNGEESNVRVANSSWLVVRASSIIFMGIYFMFYLKVNLYMNYEYRFWIPVLPFSIILFMPYINIFKGLIKNKIEYISLIITLIYVVVIGLKLKDQLRFTQYYHSLMEEEWKPMAEFLQKNYPKDTRVAVMMDVGAIGYYSGYEILDLGRLNDRYLARENPILSQELDYVYNWDPDVMVFTSFSDSAYQYIPEAMAIQADPRFSSYRLIRKFGNSVDFPYFQYLYSKATKEQGLETTALLHGGTERN